MTGRIIEAELRITGSDKSGAAFAGVIKHARELQRTLGGMKGLALNDPGFAKVSAEIKEQTRLLNTERRAAQELQRSLALANGEMARHASLFARAKGVYNSAAGQLGLMATGAMAGHTVRRAAVDAADLGHQRALLAAGGMSPAEIKTAGLAAWKASRAVPTTTAADSLKAIGELRMVFGDTNHAIEHLQPVLRATAAMRAVNPHMDAENESYNIARALELKGVSNDPHHFTRLLDRMVQAVNASRGKITGSEFFEFTKYAQAGRAGLSDGFYATVAPTLMQELGGHSAGVAFATMRQAIVGGKVTNKAAEAFENLGLLDPSSVIRTKGGQVKGFRPGGMQGTAVFNSDPYLWVQQILKPALDNKGIVGDKVPEYLAHLFGNRNAESFASILLNQKQRIEKDRHLIEGAPNANSIDGLVSNDPKTAMRDLAAAVTDFLAAAGDPLMKPGIAGLNGLAGMMRSIGQGIGGWAPNNPLLAGAGSAAALGGAGYLGLKGFQAMWGFGLTGSATALNGSAAALTAAAARLAAGGAAGAVGTAATGAGGTAAGVAGGVAGRVLLRAAGPVGLAAGVLYPDNTAGKDVDEPSGPGKFTLQDIRNIMENNRYADTMREAPKAELTGHAEITQKIEVSPSPDFLTRIRTEISNSIRNITIGGATPSTGSSGPTGRSMPEAGPMP